MSYKYNVDPSVSYLSELLKKIQKGVVQVPRFQRTLVWEWDQQRELLCSIYEGLPIGAILIWNTNRHVNSYSSIGPFKLNQDNFGTPYTYLMDGLQRLSTLYGMVLHPHDEVITPDTLFEYEVFCDLTANTVDDLFLLKKEVLSSSIQNHPYQFMPLRNVFDSRELLKFQRSIPEDMEHLIDISDKVVSAFKEYKIPVIPFETDDQALVTKSFERINSRGTDMSETHMLNALSYSDGFELLEKLEQLRESYLDDLPLWKTIDIQFVLLALKVRLGLDPYEKNTDKLANKLKLMPNSIDEVFAAIRSLADFAFEHLNIDSPKSFPYKLQMLAITELAFENKLDSYKKLILSWFWISSYCEIFGTTARNSLNSLSDFRSLVKTGELIWSLKTPPSITPLTSHKKFNYRQARTKIWAYSFAQKLNSSLIKSNNIELLNKYKGSALFQPKIFKDREKRPGYCFLIDPSLKTNFDISRIPNSELSCNFLSDEILNLFYELNFEEFAIRREQLMFEWEIETLISPSCKTLGIQIEDVIPTRKEDS